MKSKIVNLFLAGLLMATSGTMHAEEKYLSNELEESGFEASPPKPESDQPSHTGAKIVGGVTGLVIGVVAAPVVAAGIILSPLLLLPIALKKISGSNNESSPSEAQALEASENKLTVQPTP